MYCDLWPYVLWPLDFQIQKRIVSVETIWGNTVNNIKVVTSWNVILMFTSFWFPLWFRLRSSNFAFDRMSRRLVFWLNTNLRIILRAIISTVLTIVYEWIWIYNLHTFCCLSNKGAFQAIRSLVSNLHSLLKQAHHRHQPELKSR